MNKLLLHLLIIAALFWSCLDSTTEKYQSNRNKVVNVHDKLVEFNKEEVLISSSVQLAILGDYLIITDTKSSDKFIHLFDKKSFSHVTSIADRGQGPGEIANLAYVAVDEINRAFLVSDYGKQSIFAYPLDSVLTNPSYMPEVKTKLDKSLLPHYYQYINDTLSIGDVVEPVGNNDFKQYVGKWNMNTGEITRMKYEHPDIYRRRIIFDASIKHGIYVECYRYLNLMTICNLDGDLKYNIYGSNWDGNGRTNRITHYCNVEICNNRIFAAHSGGDSYSKEREYYATKFFVFDLTGEYIQTIETGCVMLNFCYDKENNRLIMAFDDEIQFGYLELDGLLE
jgi:WD40 repeat protein